MQKDISYKYTNNGLFPIRYIQRKNFSEKSKENLNKGFKTLGVSDVTMRKIKTACRVLSYASQKVMVRNSKGEYINHLCMFITLTLPSEQNHSDTEITKIIVGDFLDRCRKLNVLKNYVWRAEKQKNNNIHYHLITDSYLSYSMVYRLWKLALNKLGYLDAYKEKFTNMSFSDYVKLKHNKGLVMSKIADKYAKGKKENWSNPPCVQADYCADITQVSGYISKYASKKSAQENIVTGRIWAVSQSVSDAVKKFKTDHDFNFYWYNLGAGLMKRKVIEFEFFQVVDFKYSSLLAWFGDVKGYVANIFSSVFVPCSFYKKYIGQLS